MTLPLAQGNPSGVRRCRGNILHTPGEPVATQAPGVPLAGGNEMPSKPKTVCSYPGCNELTDVGRCDKHRPKPWQDYDDSKRGSAQERGYNSRWQKARITYLKRHPLCVVCEHQGRLTPATVVDHRTPHRGDQALFWDTGNWQPLCRRCHAEKTARGE